MEFQNGYTGEKCLAFKWLGAMEELPTWADGRGLRVETGVATGLQVLAFHNRDSKRYAREGEIVAVLPSGYLYAVDETRFALAGWQPTGRA